RSARSSARLLARLELGKGRAHGRALRLTRASPRGLLAATRRLEAVVAWTVTRHGSRGGVHLHGQADAFAGRIDLEHLHLDDVPRLHDLACVGDEAVG